MHIQITAPDDRRASVLEAEGPTHVGGGGSAAVVGPAPGIGLRGRGAMGTVPEQPHGGRGGTGNAVGGRLPAV